MEEQAEKALESTRNDSLEATYQRELSRLTPGSVEFKALLRARRKGKSYLQPMMFWPSARERDRGRS